NFQCKYTPFNFYSSYIKCSFSIFTHLNLRASQQKRPKTERFWVDVFPYLTDES
ncbi:hypothetical protein C1646_717908, partial [Rhizophagus diaphanus]